MGGVVVSYFEWLKNINHVSYGKMTWKHEEFALYSVLESVEKSLRDHFKNENIEIKPTAELLDKITVNNF